MRVAFIALGVVAFITTPVWAISGGTGKTCDVRDFGAKGDGVTPDTNAIQHAIEACAAHAGGGLVRLGDRGTFLSGPLALKSHVRFDIEGQSNLLSQHTRLKTSDRSTTAAMLTATNIEDVAITGSGTIDGDEPHAQVDAERVPHAIELLGVTGGRIEGPTLLNSGGIGVTMSREVKVSNVHITSPELGHLPGIDVLSSSNVKLEQVGISVGGKALTLSAGDADDSKRTSSDVKITDCTLRGADGLTIEAGQHIQVDRIKFVGVATGISMQAKRANIADVNLKNVDMYGVKKPIDIQESAFAVSGILIENLKAVGAETAGSIAGSEMLPIRDLVLRNVSIAAHSGLTVGSAQGSFDSVVVKSAAGQSIALGASANVERR